MVCPDSRHQQREIKQFLTFLLRQIRNEYNHQRIISFLNTCVIDGRLGLTVKITLNIDPIGLWGDLFYSTLVYK